MIILENILCIPPVEVGQCIVRFQLNGLGEVNNRSAVIFESIFRNSPVAVGLYIDLPALELKNPQT